jgi:hypothetical protein
MSTLIVWVIVTFKIQFDSFSRTLSIFRYSKKLESTKFRKLDLFPSSGKGETPTLLGPLERANLNHWTTHISITTAI